MSEIVIIFAVFQTPGCVLVIQKTDREVKNLHFFVHFICKCVSIDKVQAWRRGESGSILGGGGQNKGGLHSGGDIKLGLKDWGGVLKDEIDSSRPV